MKKIKVNEDVDKKFWWVPSGSYNNLNKPHQIYDQVMYNYAVESIAKKYLRGKDVFEPFGGIGMSSLRYLKYVNWLILNDIDADTVEAARRNLEGHDNVKFMVGDYLDIFRELGVGVDFIDFDNFTFLEQTTFENLPELLKTLGTQAVGFLFTTSYQFNVTRNFKQNFKFIEDKFNIKFKKAAEKNSKQRSEIFNTALGVGLEKQSGGKFVLAEVWMRSNVSKLLMLRKDLWEGIVFHPCYKITDIAALFKQLRHKPLLGVED